MSTGRGNTKEKFGKACVSEQQDAFCRAYVLGKEGTRLHGEKSAIAAGYAKKSARTTASRLLTKDNIQRRILELRDELAVEVEKETGMNKVDIINEVRRIARSDPAGLFESDGCTLRRNINDIDPDLRRCIAKIKTRTEEIWEGAGRGREQIGVATITEISLWDKNSSLDKAMRHLGLYEEDNAQRRGLLPEDLTPGELRAIRDAIDWMRENRPPDVYDDQPGPSAGTVAPGNTGGATH